MTTFEKLRKTQRECQEIVAKVEQELKEELLEEFAEKWGVVVGDDIVVNREFDVSVGTFQDVTLEDDKIGSLIIDAKQVGNEKKIQKHPLRYVISIQKVLPTKG
jgi:hypothetical protein